MTTSDLLPGRPGRVDCAVVIVTYNSAGDIPRALDLLPAAAARLTLRTVVVDNGSTDATVQLARAPARRQLRGVRGANLGYAGEINVGRAHARDYSALLVLNPDAALEAGALREMFAALQEDARVGIVAPMLLDADGHPYRRLSLSKFEPCTCHCQRTGPRSAPRPALAAAAPASAR
jgi:GT2 family glycosyltransferase